MTDRIADRDDLEEFDDDRAPDGHDRADPSSSPTDSTDPAAAVTSTGTTGPPSWWARRREQRRNRVSKWDRPPDPKDWRYFVGTLGKILIATGLLMFGFVAYQLWGTGIETARAQNRLEDAFAAAIAANSDSDDRDDAAEPATPDVTDPQGDTEQPEAPGDPEQPETPGVSDQLDEAVDDDPLPELPDPVPSAVVPGGVDLSDIAVDQDVPPIDRGDVIARLEIPRIDQDLYVVAGVTLDDLKDGPGWYPESSLPGQLGNAAIAGHRTTYGAPFFDVDQLAADDQLIVTTVTGDRYVYEVTGVQVVSASDYWVVTTRDPDVAELTLTSCHPKYTARDRIVVHSVLVPELSSNVGVTERFAVDGTDVDTEAIPGDDPTVADPAAAEPATTLVDDDPARTGDLTATVDPDAANDLVGGDDPASEATAPAETAPEPTEPAVDEPADEVEQVPTAPEPGTVDEPEQLDAFSQGWFDDDEAWPQIALWGFALTLISLLAYQVSKRTRHDSIGFAVGIGPFLFCLYFFFQNINRLLPPGL